MFEEGEGGEGEGAHNVAVEMYVSKAIAFNCSTSLGV